MKRLESRYEYMVEYSTEGHRHLKQIVSENRLEFSDILRSLEESEVDVEVVSVTEYVLIQLQSWHRL